MTGERRRDPETFLQRAKEEEARRSRGKLKIFFGSAAGVGKTYAMLEAAREQRAGGVDVVAGVVETHKRAEAARTALGYVIGTGAWTAGVWWVRANRVALDQTAWCACAATTVRIRVVTSSPASAPRLEPPPPPARRPAPGPRERALKVVAAL